MITNLGVVQAEWTPTVRENLLNEDRFNGINWIRGTARRQQPILSAGERVIHLKLFLNAKGTRGFCKKGTFSSMSPLHLLDEIQLVLRKSTSTQRLELHHDIVSSLEYGLSQSHSTTIVAGLRNDAGEEAGTLSISFDSL